ncbi:hypothetical protein Q604_UNBC14058G0002, partial [human gut metagenome]
CHHHAALDRTRSAEAFYRLPDNQNGNYHEGYGIHKRRERGQS